MSIYEIGKCSYCGEENKILRPSPFMADAKAMMCEYCWNETQKEYAASNGEYITDFDSNKKEYRNLKDSINNGITVYQIFLEGMTGWISKDITGFRPELEAANDDYFENEPDKQMNIDFIMKCLAVMKPGDEFLCKEVKFKCFKITETEYNNLPEFAGW